MRLTYWFKKVYSVVSSVLQGLSHNEESLLLLLLVVFAFFFGYFVLGGHRW